MLSAYQFLINADFIGVLQVSLPQFLLVQILFDLFLIYFNVPTSVLLLNLEDQIFLLKFNDGFLIRKVVDLIDLLTLNSHNFGNTLTYIFFERLDLGLIAVDSNAYSILWDLFFFVEFLTLCNYFFPKGRIQYAQAI